MDMRSGPVASECSESGRGTDSRMTFKKRSNSGGIRGRSRVKGYSVDVAPVPLVDESSRLQRHWFMYQLHIFNKFWGFKHIQHL